MLENKDEPNAEATDPLPRNGRWRTWFLGAALYGGSLVAGGIICLAVIWFQRAATPIPADLETEAPPSAFPGSSDLVEVKMTLSPEERLSLADQQFVSGDHRGAADMYRQLLTDTTPLSQLALQYRIALCQEKLSDSESALASFLAILDSPDITSMMQHAARLGQARCWRSQSRYEPARSMLLGNLLASSQPSVVAHSLHTLGQLTTEEIQPNETSFFDDTYVFTHLPTRDEPYLLGLVAAPTPSSEANPTSPGSAPVAGVSVSDKYSTHPRDIQVTVHRTASVTQLLKEVAEATGIVPVIPDDIRNAIKSRVVVVDVGQLDLATVLDGLLEPAGLVWFEEDGKVVVQRIDQVPAPRIQGYRMNQALRLCRTALALYPDHRLSTTTFLSLGNLSFWNGQYGDALSSYRELERRVSETESMAMIAFNQAKSQLRLGRRDSAREAFFRVVDLARGRSIESIAYLFVGRLYLEDLDADNGNRHLARGLSRARQKEARRVGAVTLAAGYVMTGNPLAANQTLMEHRELLGVAPYVDRAAFLSALARFRATLEPSDRLRRGHELTASLASVEPSRWFSCVGHLLAGQAYGEIGLSSQRLAVFQHAIEVTQPSGARSEMILAVATHFADARRWQSAKDYFQMLADGSGSLWDWRARYGLARLAFDSSDDDSCLQRCFELLANTKTTEDKSTVLKLMGRVYERRADHYKAALCFAGMVPTMKSEPVLPSAN